MKSTPKWRNNSSAVTSVNTYDTYLRIRPYIHSSIVCPCPPPPLIPLDVNWGPCLNLPELFNSCINSTNVHLCNYCTKIFVIVVNTCVCRRSVNNKASHPIHVKDLREHPCQAFTFFLTTCSLQVGEDWIIGCCKINGRKRSLIGCICVPYNFQANIPSSTTCKIWANFPAMASLGGGPTFKKKSEKFVVVSLRPV